MLAKLLTLPTSAFALALATGSTSADWHTDIGWDDFKAELGGGYPDGTNVLVVQSEADGSGAAGLQYIPNPASAQMTGKTITPWSPEATVAMPSPLLGICFWGGALGGAVEGIGEGRKGVAALSDEACG